jgi:hypothetical protein
MAALLAIAKAGSGIIMMIKADYLDSDISYEYGII